MTLSAAEKLGLNLQPLAEFFEHELIVEGTGGIAVPYHGIVVCPLRIPRFPTFQEDVAFLVVNDSEYGDRVPYQIGNAVIESLVKNCPENDVGGSGDAWTRARTAHTIRASSQSNRVSISPNLEDIPVILPTKLVSNKKITLKPFEYRQVRVKAAKLKYEGPEKAMGVVEAPEQPRIAGLDVPNILVDIPIQTKFVTITIRNLSARDLEIPEKTDLGELVPIESEEFVETKMGELELAALQAEEAGCVFDKKEAPEPVSKEGAPELKTPDERFDMIKNKMDKSGIEQQSPEVQREFWELIREYQDIFALAPMDHGRAVGVTHKIKLEDETPFKEAYRRIPPAQWDIVRSHIKEMIDLGVIKRSHSPWASAIVLAKKKDGSHRLCIDFRKLNARTKRDAYALPRIDDTLDCLNGACWFSSLDLKWGYWQVPMDEDSKEYTAFTVGPLGHYQFERMPFGLTNAPATFQRLMETTLGDLNLTWCLIYLDDIIVHSRVPTEMLIRLRCVFERIRQADLKLKPSKCEFFKEKVTYLGHTVSKEGIHTDPSKIEVIKTWPVPKTVTDVRRFLGFANHYRKFIKGYAKIAKPLHLLTAGENTNKKNAPVTWNSDCQLAFETIIQKVTEAPVLKYADYNRPFILNTDASGVGLGAALYQKDDQGNQRPVAFASRTINGAESRYPAHKLEFLALKWAITDQFHEYLCGSKCEVFTDNNPLTYILTSAKLDATGQRWRPSWLK